MERPRARVREGPSPRAQGTPAGVGSRTATCKPNSETDACAEDQRLERLVRQGQVVPKVERERKSRRDHDERRARSDHRVRFGVTCARESVQTHLAHETGHAEAHLRTYDEVGSDAEVVASFGYDLPDVPA